MNSRVSRREWLLLTAGLASGQTDVNPAEELFVRNHFSEPRLLLSSWKLRVEGRVRQPLDLTFSDLLEMPAVKLEAVLECAGNGANGNGIGAGVWQGVSLAQLLRDAGSDPNGDVMLEAFDEGQLLRDRPRTPYLRIVPRNKCGAPESLLAYKRNGRLLPRRNGFPVRALFPGWYGMDSVKWLRRIVVLGADPAPPSYGESGMPSLYSRLRHGVSPHRITALQVKSMIAYPPSGAKLAAGMCQVAGFAWSGAGLIQQVEVSSDGGKAWSPARLDPAPGRFTWIQWTFPWEARPGEHVLMSRARDSAGNVQPLARDPERLDSYELNSSTGIPCVVK